MAIFNKIPGNRVKRSAFDLSHERKFSCNMGELIPILCEEVVPGDTFRGNTESLVRLAPMVAPMMHRVNVYTHFFFVPNRLIWSEWENFITGGEDGQALPAMPFFRLNNNQLSWIPKGSVADYMGINIATANTPVNTDINALPLRAYSLIWNEYYRDQNLQTKLVIDKSSGQKAPSGDYFLLRKRNWEKDYFTSALPFTQKGGDVTLPFSGNAEVVLNSSTLAAGNQQIRRSDGNLAAGQSTLQQDSGEFRETSTSAKTFFDPNGTLEADLSGVSASSIEELRRATKLQQWLERNARGGSRYIEQILSHFGVRSSDARLQRPEYLGGGKSPIVISEVLQTSSTDGTSPQANMSGHGVGTGNTHRFKKYFEEHGYVIGIMSVMPRTAYIQGTRRHFFKNDKFDYYWPEFAQLGEQPVYLGEVGNYQETSVGKGTFGYQSRYAEYKFIPSTVHGDFKDNLNFWHMSRNIAGATGLNSTFVTADPTHRVFAVTDPAIDKLYVQVYNNLKAIRPMPYFNVPTL